MMRKKYKALKRPYEVKHYKIVGGFAVFLSGLMAGLYIVPGTNCTLSFPEVVILIIWSSLGLGFYLYCKKRYATKIFSDIDDGILMEKNLMYNKKCFWERCNQEWEYILVPTASVARPE